MSFCFLIRKSITGSFVFKKKKKICYLKKPICSSYLLLFIAITWDCEKVGGGVPFCLVPSLASF